jgi:hypothetical protein
VEPDVHGGAFPQLDRISGQGAPFRHEGGGQVPLVNRLPDYGTSQAPDKKAGFPGGLGIQAWQSFTAAYRAGSIGGTGTEGFYRRRSGVFPQENTHFKGYMGLVQKITSEHSSEISILPKKQWQI